MQSSNLESAAITFGKVRRWLVAAFGVFVAAKGVYRHDWLSLLLGAAIIAYGLWAPT